MAFKLILNNIRDTKGYTQTSMAKRLGIARQTYLDLESGKTEPRYRTLVELSKIFDVPISYWFPVEVRDSAFDLSKVDDEELLDEILKRLKKAAQ